MKYLLTLLAVLASVHFSRAQNTAWSTTGSIGIGTTAPSSLLSFGPSAGNKKLFIYDSGIEASGLGQSSAEFRIFSIATGTNHLSLGKYDLPSDTFYEQMRISNEGNVGIGTNSPSAKLHIFNNSNNATNLILSANYNNAYSWRFNTVDRGNAIDLDITASNSSDAQQTILKLSPTISGRPALTLMSNWLVANNGNIGINTTDNATWQLANSVYKLAVGGGMIAESVTVKTLNNWPDYVFKPTYKLPSLSEVNTYIDQNQHLPEMPSAEDVEKNGVNLGEMVKLQTKKIEELTLYLIEKDKETQALKESKEAQQQQLDLLKQQLAALAKEIHKN